MAKHNIRRTPYANLKKPQSEYKPQGGYLQMLSGSRGAGKTVSSARMAAEAYYASISHRQGQDVPHSESRTPSEVIVSEGSLPAISEYISRVSHLESNRAQERLLARASAFSSGNPFQSPTSQQSSQQPPPQQGIIWTNAPNSSGGWWGNGSSSAPYTPPVTTESIREQQPQKPKYSEAEMKTKFIAFVTITFPDIHHKATGVIFVRKCGAWKFIECISGMRIASGSAGAVLPDHTVHYYIYQEDDEPKSKRLFKRHETVGAE